MSENVDVAIIGAGSAGLAALREVRKQTDRFILVNDGPWGTTCARVGCMPSKVLIEAANAFHRRHDFDRFGIRGGASLAMDIPAALERVRELRDGFVDGTLKATEGLGDRAIAGRARLRGPNQIDVEGRRINARNIIIATGSRPVVPASWRAFGERILTTDTLFEQRDLERRIAVIGMGAIGVEMAQALARLGVDVIAFGSARSLAGLSDPVVAETVESLLREEFAIHLGSSAEIVPEGDALRVHNGKVSVVVDTVLAAMGRRPNVDDLGLDTLGVALDERGMPPVDPRTTRIGELPVFFAGDANGYAPVLHEAADEGHIAGLNAVSHSPRCFTRRTPIAIVFSAPNIAVVGKRHSELDDAATIVGAVSFERQGRARAALRDKGVMRIYADRHSGVLLGAEMCAPAGEHMAHLLALAIGRSLTVHDLLRLPFYHPVLEEGMRSALRELAKQLPKCSDSDLASCTDFGLEALD